MQRTSRWRIHPIAKRLGIPTELVAFQVMRRTLGSDLQQHGTMKGAQQILRHASIRRRRTSTCSRSRRVWCLQSTHAQERSFKTGARSLLSKLPPQRFHVRRRDCCKCLKNLAPQVGLEPTTLRLTASWDFAISRTLRRR